MTINTPLARAKSGGFVPSLTGIRCLAASLVFLTHGWEAVGLKPNRLVEHGYLGVDLFFILSGFIIAYSFARNFRQPTAAVIRGFLWKRLARLYPAHLAVLLIFLFLFICARVSGYQFNDSAGWSATGFVAQLALIQAWGLVDHIGWNAVSWSVSAEWFAYLLFPLIAPAATRVTPRMATFVACLALAGLFLVFTLFGWGIRTSWLGIPALVRVTAEFMCGVAIWRSLSAVGRHSFADALGAGCVALFIVGAAQGWSDFILVAILAICVAAASRANGKFDQFLSSRPMVFIGQISYSIYLVHFLVVRVTYQILVRAAPDASPSARVFTLLVSAIVTLALATALFYVIEQPFRRRLLAWRLRVTRK